MSSASVELATIVSALVGALVAMRRSRRAQRTITKLDALALRKPINSAPTSALTMVASSEPADDTTIPERVRSVCRSFPLDE